MFLYRHLFRPLYLWAVLIISIIFHLSGHFEIANAIPVFPGAEGFGTQTRAAYGGAKQKPVICIVTSLEQAGGSCDDSSRNGAPVKTGTLLQCINFDSKDQGKVILFEVSGTINATSSPYVYDITDPYTTIAGQSAPSPGITLRNLTLEVRTHDVLIQHIRARVGDAVNGTLPKDRRCINAISNASYDVYNVVFDHLSMSWSVDSIATNWIIKDSGGAIHDVTWSNCIVSEGLNDSLHPSPDPHSKGLVVGPGDVDIAVLYNLMSSNVDRNPYLRGGTGVVVNNFIYNPDDFNIIIAKSSYAFPGELVHSYSIVGNHVEGGPSSGSYAKNTMPTFWAYLSSSSQIYFFNNKCNAGKQSSASDWSFVRWGGGLSDMTSQVRVLSAPIWPTGLVAMDVDDVKAHVLDNVGARPADRDSVDARLINEANSGGTLGAIIDSPSDVGGWPYLAENTRNVATGMQASIGPIPPNPHDDDDDDGYTNLEEWLHKLSAQVESSRGPDAPTLIIKSGSS